MLTNLPLSMESDLLLVVVFTLALSMGRVNLSQNLKSSKVATSLLLHCLSSQLSYEIGLDSTTIRLLHTT